jgi:hypothetical protein
MAGMKFNHKLFWEEEDAEIGGIQMYFLFAYR